MRRRQIGGAPLPSQLSDAGRRRWSDLLSFIIAGAPADHPPVDGNEDESYYYDRWRAANSIGPKLTITQTAKALQVDRLYLRRMLAGKRGVSPDSAWSYGEALAGLPGRERCSGLLALAALQDYEIHVIGWLGTLLSGHEFLEPFLNRSSLDALVAIATQPGLFSAPSYDDRSSGVKLFNRVARGKRIEWIEWSMRNEQREAATRAWQKWARYANPRRLPQELQVAIVALRMADEIGDPWRAARLKSSARESLSAYLRQELALGTIDIIFGDPVEKLRNPYQHEVLVGRKYREQAWTSMPFPFPCDEIDPDEFDHEWIAGLISDATYLSGMEDRRKFWREWVVRYAKMFPRNSRTGQERREAAWGVRSRQGVEPDDFDRDWIAGYISDATYISGIPGLEDMRRSWRKWVVEYANDFTTKDLACQGRREAAWRNQSQQGVEPDDFDRDWIAGLISDSTYVFSRNDGRRRDREVIVEMGYATAEMREAEGRMCDDDVPF